MPSYQVPQASPALGHLCKNPTCENIEKTTLLGEKSQQNSAERARVSQVSFFMPSYQVPQASPALGHLCKNPTCENIEKTTLLGEKSQQNSAERARVSQVSPAGLLHSECCHEQQAELTHQDRHLCKKKTNLRKHTKAALLGEKSEQNSAERAKFSRTSACQTS